MYPESEAQGREPADSNGVGTELVSISVKEMPLTDFLRVLAARNGISVIWAEGLDRRLVSVEAVGVPVNEVFEGLARRFGVSVQRVGQSWYVGEFRNEDRATLVRKTVRLSPDDVSSAVGVVLGETGRVKCFKDGLCIVSAPAESCRRIAAVFDEIEAARCDSWVVQLYLFSCSHEATHDLGLDTSALIDLSYTFAKKSLAVASSSSSGATPIATPLNGSHLASSFGAVMKAAATRSDVSLVGKPLFVLGDGETSSFVSGISVPVPKKTVSDQGTVTTSGYDMVQSGLSSDVSLREGPHGTAMLTAHISLGQITGYVESVPIQAKNEFSTSAVVASSGVYLLGALDEDDATIGATGLAERLLSHSTKDVKRSQIQIWARLYRIAAPMKMSRMTMVEARDPQLRSHSALDGPLHSAAEIIKPEFTSQK